MLSNNKNEISLVSTNTIEILAKPPPGDFLAQVGEVALSKRNQKTNLGRQKEKEGWPPPFLLF